jgi:AcrR family transcriptional regulator
MTAYGDEVRGRAKAIALEQLAEGGPEAVSVNAIGRRMGVSGPALYRHFANRDDLLASLTIDAYESLAAALAGSDDGVDGLAHAYRDWALAQPHRYLLLFAPPVPGFDAHRDDLVTAAQKAMEPLLAALETDDHERATLAWSRMHGLVSLELGGNFASMGLDGRALLERELAAGF